MAETGDLIVQAPGRPVLPCRADFHIDPWRPVARAVITHAHADHARRGHGAYLATAISAGVLRARLGSGITLARPGLWRGGADINGVRVSACTPPAMCWARPRCGSEHRGPACGWPRATISPAVDTDDSQRPPAPLSSPCAATVSSPKAPSACPSTAGGRKREVMAEHQRMVGRQRRGRPRQPAAGLQLRQGAAPPDGREGGRGGRAWGPIVVHGAVDAAEPGLPRGRCGSARHDLGRGCHHGQGVSSDARWWWRRRRVLGSAWARKLGEQSDAFASGWMQLRGARRRQGVDRGFVLSATTPTGPGLQRAIASHRRRAA